MKKKLVILTIICITLFSYSIFASDSLYVWSPSSSSNSPSDSSNKNNTINTTNQTTANTMNNNIINTSTQISDNNSLNLESGAATLIDESTGNVLYSHNAHEQLRPASVTKVMSLLLIMEAVDSGKISLTDTVPCSEKAHSMGGSQIWLEINVCCFC